MNTVRLGYFNNVHIFVWHSVYYIFLPSRFVRILLNIVLVLFLDLNPLDASEYQTCDKYDLYTVSKLWILEVYSSGVEITGNEERNVITVSILVAFIRFAKLSIWKAYINNNLY